MLVFHFVCTVLVFTVLVFSSCFLTITDCEQKMEDMHRSPGVLTLFGFVVASMIALDHANTPLVIIFLSEVCAANAPVSHVRNFDTGVVYSLSSTDKFTFKPSPLLLPFYNWVA